MLRRKLRKNKKGSLLDLVMIGAVILFFGMVLLFGFKVTSAFNDEIQSRSDIPANAKTSTATLTAHYTGTMDYGMLLLAIGLGIITLVLAAAVRVHPVFIPLYFMGLVLVIIFSAVFSNIYQEMAANSQMTAYADQLVFTSHILTYLPLLIGVFGILLMIVMYKLWQSGQEG